MVFVVFPFISLYGLLRFFFDFLLFPCRRILLFCYFVSVLHPPRAGSEPQVCLLALCAVFFHALLQFTYFFHSLPSSSSIRFGHRFFHPVLFLWVLGPILSGCKKSVFRNQKSRSKTDRRKNPFFQSNRTCRHACHFFEMNSFL